MLVLNSHLHYVHWEVLIMEIFHAVYVHLVSPLGWHIFSTFDLGSSDAQEVKDRDVVKQTSPIL